MFQGPDLLYFNRDWVCGGMVSITGVGGCILSLRWNIAYSLHDVMAYKVTVFGKRVGFL